MSYGMASIGAQTPPVGANEAPAKLEPRLIKGMQADYVEAPWPGTNISGLTPYGPNVLVRMDSCSDTTSGGILLPGDIKERMDEAATTGCVYAIGPDAFRGYANRPEVGQRVHIEKYSGIKARGRDGELYRTIDEKCVGCGIIPEGE